MTVQVVVPKPPVTFISSSSILIRNPLAGNPVAEATLIVVCDALIALGSVVEAPGPTRQTYELVGVRSTTPTLLSLAG